MREDQARPLQHLNDAELVQRAQTGERAAFESLFHRHQDRVYTVALAILGNPSDAKDIVQETFVRAYKRLGTLPADGGIVAFLRRTAVNASIDVVRSRRTAKQVSLESLAAVGGDLQDRGRGPDAYVEALENNEALMQELLTLPEEQRFVLVLHHLEGMRVDEVADMLGIPIGTVKSRLGRGREALRRKMYGKVIE